MESAQRVNVAEGFVGHIARQSAAVAREEVAWGGGRGYLTVTGTWLQRQVCTWAIWLRLSTARLFLMFALFLAVMCFVQATTGCDVEGAILRQNTPSVAAPEGMIP